MPDYDADLWAFVDASYAMTPTFAVGDLRVVLTERNGITYAAFPGTRPDHLEDWLTALAAWPSQLIGHPEAGPCHSGVINAVEAAFQAFTDAVSGSKRLMAGGHSLGGGFALGMGALARSRGIVFERLTTFGALRVGMDKFCRLLDPIAGVRYRNGNDMVPEMPAWIYDTDRAWTRIGHPAPNWIDNHVIKAYGTSLGLLAPVPVAA